jgi:hypothetical protein
MSCFQCGCSLPVGSPNLVCSACAALLPVAGHRFVCLGCSGSTWSSYPGVPCQVCSTPITTMAEGLIDYMKGKRQDKADQACICIGPPAADCPQHGLQQDEDAWRYLLAWEMPSNGP